MTMTPAFCCCCNLGGIFDAHVPPLPTPIFTRDCAQSTNQLADELGLDEGADDEVTMTDTNGGDYGDNQEQGEDEENDDGLLAPSPLNDHRVTDCLTTSWTHLLPPTRCTLCFVFSF